MQSANWLPQGDGVGNVHVMRIHATPRVSCVRTVRTHVRLYVFLLLLSCTTRCRASGLGSSVFLVNTDLRRCVQSPMRRSR